MEQPALDPTIACLNCKFVISPDWYFCPNCGKKLKMKPLATSVGRQCVVYLVSLIFPPFGLFPAVNYLRQKETKAKIIGAVCILLTLLSVGLTTWYTIILVNQINTQLTKDVAPLRAYGY